MTDLNAEEDSSFRSRELELRRELELAKINNDAAIKRRELDLAEKRIALEAWSLTGWMKVIV